MTSAGSTSSGSCPSSNVPTRATADPDALQLVASPTMPHGLALLDAPDIDSVVERNRSLAAQLLAAADLWLFVTSAARYADQVPWGFLKQAAERSAAVAIVLDRTRARCARGGERPPGPDAHLARAQGLATVHRPRVAARRAGPAAGDGGRGHPRLAPRARRRRRGPQRRRTPDPRRRHPLDRAAYLRHRRRLPGAGRHAHPAEARRRRRLRPGRRPTSTPARPTAPCCAARCSPAGRSSSAPASCCARWSPR